MYPDSTDNASIFEEVRERRKRSAVLQQLFEQRHSGDAVEREYGTKDDEGLADTVSELGFAPVADELDVDALDDDSILVESEDSPTEEANTVDTSDEAMAKVGDPLSVFDEVEEDIPLMEDWDESGIDGAEAIKQEEAQLAAEEISEEEEQAADALFHGIEDTLEASQSTLVGLDGGAAEELAEQSMSEIQPMLDITLMPKTKPRRVMSKTVGRRPSHRSPGKTNSSSQNEPDSASKKKGVKRGGSLLDSYFKGL